MADVDVAPVGTTSETATNSRVFCNPTGGAESFSVDLAPDGKYYGWGAEQCNAIYRWGTLDPAAFVGGPTPTGVVPLELVPFAGVFRPSFLQEVPDPGSPIGYRFDNQDIDGPGCGTGSRSTGNLGGTCDVDLYAVDSLTPYREHLIASHFEPNRFNFTIGTAVTVFPDAPGVTTSQTSRTNAYFITTDAVYCYGPGPMCPSSVSTGKAVQAGFLFSLRLSRNARVMSSSQPGRVFITDGATVFNLDADPTSGFFRVTNSFQTTGLTQIASGSHYACLPGGVHFEPDDTLYVDERGATATKAVSLTYAPTADVTISFSISDPARATVSPASLTFTPTNWNTPQTITITGVDDGIPGNGAQPFVLNTAPLSSSDPNYSGRIVRSFAGITQEAAGPTITAVAPIQTQLGSQITTTIATVSDADDAAGTLAATAEPSFHSVQFGPLTNTNGTVTTTITVPCTAQQPYGAFGSPRRYVLDVADADGNTRSDVVQVATAPAGNPVISYANTIVTAGQTTIIPPATFDGSGSSIGVSPDAGFTGSITPDPLTGNLTVSNANPPGSYTVNISTTGRCNNLTLVPPAPSTTNTSFTMRVNAPPSLTPGSATVQQGSPAITANLGTVSDLETPAGSLTVTAVSIPSGVTLGTITNTSGTITAPISASCTSPTGPQTLTLQVTDGDGASTNANVTVNVTANTPPTIGTYAATSMQSGTSININPSGPPSDNGSVTVTAAAPNFSGSISANSSTGAIAISNAGPAGTYNVTVTATDNCGASASTSFTLTVFDCRTTIAPTSVNVSSAAGSGSVNISAHAGCSWTATGNSFVTITGGSSGSGNGTVTYGYTQNTAATGRSTTLVIAGVLLTVTQSAAGVSTFPMTATASTNQVSVSWSAVPGATSYQVHRSDGFIAPTAALSYNDTSVTPGNGYVYQVWAIGSSGVIAYSNPDLAVPFNYTNAVATGGVIRAADFTELREAANAALVAVGLPPMSFSGTIAAGTAIQAIHLTEIRSAVDQARAAVGLTPLSYTDPTIAPGTTIVRAAHVNELRNGLQ